MADLSPHKLSYCHVRYTSLPARLDPSAKKIEEELNKLRSFESYSSLNSETIFANLSSLTDIYKSVVCLSSLPALQHALAQHQLQSSINQLLDLSLKYLDICGKLRDAASLMKGNVRELRFAIRRKKGGDLSVKSHIHSYICLRKAMQKEISKFLLLLKEVDLLAGASPALHGLNYQTSVLIKMLIEVCTVTGFMLGSLLLFMSTTVPKPKPTRWASVLKLVKKKDVLSATEGQTEKANEFEATDTELSKFLFGQDVVAARIQSLLAKLEAADLIVEDLENSLECLFRRMIQARVSLLNILSM